MKGPNNITETVFSITLFVSLIGGGVVALLYTISLLIGGSSGESLAVMTKSQVLPWFIRIAAIAVLFGLIQIYTSGEHSLSMDTKSEED